jgi:hypothetical protein
MVESLILNFLPIKFIGKGNKQKMLYKTNERVFIVNIYLKLNLIKPFVRNFSNNLKEKILAINIFEN